MKTGWARIYRCVEDNPMWLGEKFSRGQAWVDLIVFANHKPSYFFVRGNRVNLDRGQIGWSQSTMATRWKWSRKKVANFLQTLEKEQQIVQQKNTVTTVITIINYEKYQAERTADVATEEPQKNRRLHTNKNVKNVKNNTPPTPPNPGRLTLTEEQVWKIVKGKRVHVDVVREIYQQFQEWIARQPLKEQQSRIAYNTVGSWIERRLSDGKTKRLDDVEFHLVWSDSPEERQKTVEHWLKVKQGVRDDKT